MLVVILHWINYFLGPWSLWLLHFEEFKSIWKESKTLFNGFYSFVSFINIPLDYFIRKVICFRSVYVYTDTSTSYKINAIRNQSCLRTLTQQSHCYSRDKSLYFLYGSFCAVWYRPGKWSNLWIELHDLLKRAIFHVISHALTNFEWFGRIVSLWTIEHNEVCQTTSPNYVPNTVYTNTNVQKCIHFCRYFVLVLKLLWFYVTRRIYFIVVQASLVQLLDSHTAIIYIPISKCFSALVHNYALK